MKGLFKIGDTEMFFHTARQMAVFNWYLCEKCSKNNKIVKNNRYSNYTCQIRTNGKRPIATHLG